VGERQGEGGKDTAHLPPPFLACLEERIMSRRHLCYMGAVHLLLGALLFFLAGTAEILSSLPERAVVGMGLVAVAFVTSGSALIVSCCRPYEDGDKKGREGDQ
jgi:hypothetical protein